MLWLKSETSNEQKLSSAPFEVLQHWSLLWPPEFCLYPLRFHFPQLNFAHLNEWTPVYAFKNRSKRPNLIQKHHERSWNYFQSTFLKSHTFAHLAKGWSVDFESCITKRLRPVETETELSSFSWNASDSELFETHNCNTKTGRANPVAPSISAPPFDIPSGVDLATNLR